MEKRYTMKIYNERKPITAILMIGKTILSQKTFLEIKGITSKE